MKPSSFDRAANPPKAGPVRSGLIYGFFARPLPFPDRADLGINGGKSSGRSTPMIGRIDKTISSSDRRVFLACDLPSG